MTNQSSILNDHDLKEFARMAMNIIRKKNKKKNGTFVDSYKQI